MLAELLAAVAIGVAAGVVCSIFESIWGTRSAAQNLPLSLTAPMSEHDVEMADKSRKLIQECFCVDGNGVVDSIRQMNAEERMKAAQKKA